MHQPPKATWHMAEEEGTEGGGGSPDCSPTESQPPREMLAGLFIPHGQHRKSTLRVARSRREESLAGEKAALPDLPAVFQRLQH